MPSPTSSPAVWLDLLPADLRARIAIHVCNGKQNEDALNLAEVTGLQRLAVLSVLENKLNFSQSHLAERWTKVFHGSIRRVSFGQYVSFPAEASPHPLSLLSAETLHRAEIQDSEEFLSAIAGSKSVKLLRVSVQSGLNVGVLIETLKSLKLEELQLWCTEKRMTKCPIREIAMLRGAVDGIGAACDGLSAIRVHCFHRDHIWDLLPTIPQLRKVILECVKVPDAAVPLLRGLESVQIIGGAGALRLARRLGSVVTVLATSEKIDGDGFRGLAMDCPRLIDIEMGVLENVGEGLVEAAKRWGRLRNLKFRWDEPSEWWPRGHKWNVARFGGVGGGLIGRALSSMPKLESVDLLSVRLDMEELRTFLKKAGRRLRHLGTSIADQEEAPFDRLLLLLVEVMKWNTELRSLKGDVVRTQQMKLLGIMQNENAAFRSEQRVMLDMALARVKRAAPLMDVESIEQWTMWYFLD